MRALIAVALAAVVLVTPAVAWKNGGKSKSWDKPLFGTHDYVEFQGYRRAAAERIKWLKPELNAYFAGTEAPDVGESLPGVLGNDYPDTGRCHCMLFGANGDLANDRAELRVQEFDKSREALAAGDVRSTAT